MAPTTPTPPPEPTPAPRRVGSIRKLLAILIASIVVILSMGIAWYRFGGLLFYAIGVKAPDA
jgi:hypothetical protein